MKHSDIYWMAKQATAINAVMTKQAVKPGVAALIGLGAVRGAAHGARNGFRSGGVVGGLRGAVDGAIYSRPALSETLFGGARPMTTVMAPGAGRSPGLNALMANMKPKQANTAMTKQAIGMGDVAEGVGSILPGVSSVLSARDAAKSFSSGNVLGGLGHTALAGIGLIPGAGAAVGAVKGIGKAIQWGSKAMKSTGLGAKAMGAAGGIAKAVPTMATGVKGIGKAIGSIGQRTVKGLESADKSMTGTRVGGLVNRNKTVTGLGTGAASGMLNNAADTAAESLAHDKSLVGNMQNMTNAARGYNPSAQYNPSSPVQSSPRSTFAGNYDYNAGQLQQPGMMGPGAPMWG